MANSFLFVAAFFTFSDLFSISAVLVSFPSSVDSWSLASGTVRASVADILPMDAPEEVTDVFDDVTDSFMLGSAAYVRSR